MFPAIFKDRWWLPGGQVFRTFPINPMFWTCFWMGEFQSIDQIHDILQLQQALFRLQVRQKTAAPAANNIILRKNFQPVETAR